MNSELTGYIGSIFFISTVLIMLGLMTYDQKKQQQERHKKS